MSFKKLSAPPPDPAAAIAAARLADPTSPPVRVRPDETVTQAIKPEQVVGLNLRVRLSTSDAIADAAKSREVSMKAVVMDALRRAGIEIASVDLEDRTPSRRKGQ